MINNFLLLYNTFIKRKYPLTLVHFITNRCNARCSFCFIDFDNPKTFQNELSVNEIDKITKNLGPHLKNVNLTGGEPFARKEFIDIARLYFKNTNIDSIFITSNGSLPNRIDNFLKEITTEYPNKKIFFSFSIDSFPSKHNKIRKIKNLFQKVIQSHKIVLKYKKEKKNVTANIGLTVSHENYNEVNDVFDLLVKKYNMDAIDVTIVRDEGVYKIPIDKKKLILDAYTKVTKKIENGLNDGTLKGYNSMSLQGRIMNRKNLIRYDIIKKTFLKPRFLSTCHATTLFAVIGAEGTVYPCEVLNENIGNLRSYNYNFLELWKNDKKKRLKEKIINKKCNCTYECGLSTNILGNLKYQNKLLPAIWNKR